MNDLTMSDIAKLAGVGKSTVSRYFNGGYVKAETRDKISVVVEKYNYQPNALAKLMKAEKTWLIGIITPTLISSTSSRMMTALDDYIRERGFTSLIINSSHSWEREVEAYDYLSKLNVDGIVILATNVEYKLDKMRQVFNKPVVFMGQEVPNAVSIVYDDYRAGYLMGKTVCEKFHDNITYVGVSEKDQAVGLVRKSGVYAAFEDYGVKNVDYVETTFKYLDSRKVLKEYFKDHRPSVMICVTDMVALACYREVNNLGLRVPEDISIVGFDGHEFSEMITPPLTCIRFNNEEAGRVCGQTIIDMIEGKEVGYRNLISYELKPGGSL